MTSAPCARAEGVRRADASGGAAEAPRAAGVDPAWRGLGPSRSGRSVLRRAVVAIAAALACAGVGGSAPAEPVESETSKRDEPTIARATFAGGCFWCMEHPFDRLDGVLSTTVGYTGGRTEAPDYASVSAGGTGHAEAVEIRFDPSRVDYETLLAVFWRNVDPLTPDAQFCDRGSQYRSAIFVHDAAQRRAAESSRQALARSGRFDAPIVTEIVDATTFHPAEARHQDYADRNPVRYHVYRLGCGRDARLEELWGEEAGGESIGGRAQP